MSGFQPLRFHWVVTWGYPSLNEPKAGSFRGGSPQAGMFRAFGALHAVLHGVLTQTLKPLGFAAVIAGLKPCAPTEKHKACIFPQPVKPLEFAGCFVGLKPHAHP